MAHCRICTIFAASNRTNDGITQRVIQNRERPVEQPHDGPQTGCGTFRRPLPRRGRLPCDALRLAGRHGQRPPDGRGDPLGAATRSADRNRLETRNRTTLPPQRHAVRRAEGRAGRRFVEDLQHRRRRAGQRNLAARSAPQHLPPDHRHGDQGVVLQRRQNLLGVRERLRGSRNMGLPRPDLDRHVRDDPARTEQRRRTARED